MSRLVSVLVALYELLKILRSAFKALRREAQERQEGKVNKKLSQALKETTEKLDRDEKLEAIRALNDSLQ